MKVGKAIKQTNNTTWCKNNYSPFLINRSVKAETDSIESITILWATDTLEGKTVPSVLLSSARHCWAWSHMSMKSTPLWWVGASCPGCIAPSLLSSLLPGAGFEKKKSFWCWASTGPSTCVSSALLQSQLKASYFSEIFPKDNDFTEAAEMAVLMMTNVSLFHVGQNVCYSMPCRYHDGVWRVALLQLSFSATYLLTASCFREQQLDPTWAFVNCASFESFCADLF